MDQNTSLPWAESNDIKQKFSSGYIFMRGIDFGLLDLKFRATGGIREVVIDLYSMPLSCVILNLNVFHRLLNLHALRRALPAIYLSTFLVFSLHPAWGAYLLLWEGKEIPLESICTPTTNLISLFCDTRYEASIVKKGNLLTILYFSSNIISTYIRTELNIIFHIILSVVVIENNMNSDELNNSLWVWPHIDSDKPRKFNLKQDRFDLKVFWLVQ